MNLLFDLDGTLTDPFVGITECIGYALIRLGRQTPQKERLRWCIGPPLKESFKKLLGSDDDRLADEALALYRERFGSVGLFENEVYMGIPDVLGSLRSRGMNLFVATSKPTVFARRIMTHFRLAPFFKGIYGSELDGTRSTKTDLLSYIMTKEALSASESIMIGDRRYDMIGARENGVVGVGVLWGYGTQAELESSGASTCIRHPSDMMSVWD